MSEVARRIHIFRDGFGWSSRRNASTLQLRRVQTIDEIPPISRDCLITFFEALNVEDLEYLEDVLRELRLSARWGQ